MTCCNHSSLHIWISLNCFLCPHQLYSHMYLVLTEDVLPLSGILSFFAVPWQAVLSFIEWGSCDQAWSQAASKECLAGVSSILLQQLEVFFASPSPVLSGWQPHVMDSLVPASHEAHMWSLLLWNQAPSIFSNRDTATECQWCWNTWLQVPQTHFLLRSVSGTEHTEPVPRAEDNRNCQSPSLSSEVLFTSTLQLILPAGR